MANDDFLFIVMPYCSGGDLFSRVASQPELRLGEDESRYWFNHILTVRHNIHVLLILVKQHISFVSTLET